MTCGSRTAGINQTADYIVSKHNMTIYPVTFASFCRVLSRENEETHFITYLMHFVKVQTLC